MTYEEFVRLALSLPETEESLYYGEPAVKREGRAMFASRENGCSVTIKLDWDTLDELVVASPDLYFQTPHQETWPWMTANLGAMTEDQAEELLRACWEDAPKPGKRRKLPLT